MFEHIRESGRAAGREASPAPVPSGFQGAAMHRIQGPSTSLPGDPSLKARQATRTMTPVPASWSKLPVTKIPTPKQLQIKRVGVGTASRTTSGSKVRTVEKVGPRKGNTRATARVQTLRVLPGQRKQRKRKRSTSPDDGTTAT